MKKYFYYLVVLIVIVNNYILIQKNSTLQKNIEKNKSKIEEKKEKVYGVNYLHNIGSSKYLLDIYSIVVRDNMLEVTFEIKDSKKIKQMVEDTSDLFSKNAVNVRVKDDEKLILEFE